VGVFKDVKYTIRDKYTKDLLNGKSKFKKMVVTVCSELDMY